MGKPSFPSGKDNTAAQQMPTRLPDQDWQHQHGKLSSSCVCLWGVSWSLLNNTYVLSSFQSTQCVWFRSHLDFSNVRIPAGALLPRSLVRALAKWEKPCTQSIWCSPIFPCNSEAWGDDLLKWVIKTVSTFSLGSLAFEALRTRPGVPVSRCCSLKCVNQCRLAEVMSYIKRQMFNNELRKVVQRTWTQLHDGKKNGSSLPLPVSLDITNVLLKIYLCSAFSSSHPLIKHTAAHLNCSFCLLRFATVCYKAYSEGASWRGHDKSIFVKAGH